MLCASICDVGISKPMSLINIWIHSSRTQTTFSECSQAHIRFIFPSFFLSHDRHTQTRTRPLSSWGMSAVRQLSTSAQSCSTPGHPCEELAGSPIPPQGSRCSSSMSQPTSATAKAATLSSNQDGSAAAADTRTCPGAGGGHAP